MTFYSRIFYPLASLFLALGCCLVTETGGAAEPTPLRVKVFPGAQNLPLYVGLAKGIFAKHGVKVDLQFTASSTELREGLAAGAFDIAVSAVDNAVAMVEAAGKDTVIVMGGDGGMNDFIVQPEIGSFAKLRGRTLIVDAPNTAYALVARKILLNHGLKDGQDYTVKAVGGGAQRLKAILADKGNSAVLLNTPFSIQALQGGLRTLGRAVDLLGPYQANGAYVMRAWARANAEALERWIAGYVESLRWAMHPANRAECVALLSERLKLAPEMAEWIFYLLTEPRYGLASDAKFDLQGFNNLLALRAEMEGQWGGKPPAPEKYIDLSYYQRALAALGL